MKEEIRNQELEKGIINFKQRAEKSEKYWGPRRNVWAGAVRDRHKREKDRF